MGGGAAPGGLNAVCERAGLVGPLGAREIRPVAIDGVSYEPLQQRWMAQVKALHLELFPVRYSQTFYDSLIEASNMLTLLAIQHTSEGSRVIGLATVRMNEEHDWLCCRTTTVGYISTFGVAPAARRRHIGSVLLGVMCASLRARRCNEVHLHVLTDNVPAVEFYKRNGFAIVQLLLDYYFFDSRYADAYAMVLPLTPPREWCSLAPFFVRLFRPVSRVTDPSFA